MNPDHMHPVRDYFIYIDWRGDIYKLVPSRDWLGGPFIITLIHKA